MIYDDIVLHVCKYTDGLYRKCKHNCIFCCENTDQHKTNGILPTIEMIVEVLKNIHSLNNNHNNKINSIYIAGGEPTERDDLYDIVELTAKQANKVYITTHGDYAHPEIIAEKLISSGATNIAFSLHGHDHITHDAITRTNGSFEKTVNSIKTFIERGLVVSINYVVVSTNINGLKNTIDLIAREFPNIEQITFSHYRQHGEACEHNYLFFDPWKCGASINDVIDASIEKKINVKFRDFPLCIDQRLKLLNSKAEKFYVVIWKKSGEYGLFSEEAQRSLLPRCIKCDEKECSGHLTANIESYDKYSAWKKM